LTVVLTPDRNGTVSVVPTVVVPPHPPVLWTDTADRLLVALETEYTMVKFCPHAVDPVPR
jgi:hypothetical protein